MNLDAKNLNPGNIFYDSYSKTGKRFLLLKNEEADENSGIHKLTFDCESFDKWQAEPIKITEDILFELGFVYIFPESYSYMFQDLKICHIILRPIRNTCKAVVLGVKGQEVNPATLTYVHDLQNFLLEHMIDLDVTPLLKEYDPDI